MNPAERFSQHLLAHNLRIDGRQPLQQRHRSTLFLPAKGHLVFCQGESQVIVRTKAEITAPRPERPSQGFIFFRVDCSASNKNHQQQKKVSTELIKLLQTVVVGSKALDPESLCILSGRYAWKVNVECIIIHDDGNSIDCVLNGAILSLMDLRKPLIRFQREKLAVEEEIEQSLSLAHLPVSLTLALTEGNLIADPCGSEEEVSKSRITIAMNVYKQICTIHKPGGMDIDQATLSGCVKLAEQRVKESTEWLRSVLKQRPSFESSFGTF